MKNIHNIDFEYTENNIFKIIDDMLRIFAILNKDRLNDNKKFYLKYFLNECINSIIRNDLYKIEKNINTFNKELNIILNNDNIELYIKDMSIIALNTLQKIYNMLSGTKIKTFVNEKFFILEKSKGFYMFRDIETKEPINNANNILYNDEFKNKMYNIIKSSIQKFISTL